MRISYINQLHKVLILKDNYNIFFFFVMLPVYFSLHVNVSQIIYTFTLLSKLIKEQT